MRIYNINSLPPSHRAGRAPIILCIRKHNIHACQDARARIRGAIIRVSKQSFIGIKNEIEYNRYHAPTNYKSLCAVRENTHSLSQMELVNMEGRFNIRPREFI